MGDGSGDGRAADGEKVIHRVELDGFSIDARTVTNADFARFVADTGYETEAEQFGSSAVFHLALAAEDDDILARSPQTPWWIAVRGASWRHPAGRLSNVDDMGDHPVVHVSWNDALQYCVWAGRRLPTEAEWEYASRGGLEGARYPWGDDLMPEGNWNCNIWQGTFPFENSQDDGFITTAPAEWFEPNAYGIYQTVGNVWEWCADWFDLRYYSRAPAHAPAGPATGAARVLRGGSFLCHDSYCNRYRNSARSSNTPDSSMANAGFRTVSR
jgi:formylglycine-generating enzyme required for sulfatase activity